MKLGLVVGAAVVTGCGVGAHVDGAEVGALTRMTGAMAEAAIAFVVLMEAAPGPTSICVAFC